MRKTQWEDSTIDMKGFVDRKHQLQAGGLKATVRSWKNYYAILCGQLLCFFKDEQAFHDASAAAAPLNIYGALCKEDKEYLKRKHTFRLRTSDGSEFLFSCASDDEMQSWLDRIQYHAGLAPKDQLRSFSNSITSNGSGGPGAASTSSSEYRPHASSYDRGLTDTSAPVVPSHRPAPSFATIDTTPVRSSDSLTRRASGLSRRDDEERTPASTSSHSTLDRSCVLRASSASATSSISTPLPTLYDAAIPMRRVLSRRESRRNLTKSVYESIYGPEEELVVEEIQKAKPTDDEGATTSSFSPNGDGGYREVRTLEYREATSVTYRQDDCSVHRNGSPSFSDAGAPPPPTMPRKSTHEGSEFVAWVEKYGGSSQQNLSMGGNSSADDNESIKSAKKKGIGSFFKRSSSKVSK